MSTRSTKSTMNYLAKLLIFGLISAAVLVSCQQDADVLQLPANVPFYMQSPLSGAETQDAPGSGDNHETVSQIDQRSMRAQQQAPASMRTMGAARNLDAIPAGISATPISAGESPLPPPQQQQQQQQPPPPPPPKPQQQQQHPNSVPQPQQPAQQQQHPHIPTGNCFYDKHYFAKFDECLSKRPYPTVGLPAFKNEDLLVKRGLTERTGCLFVLSGGLFKNYQINKYSLDSDVQCLDSSKVDLQLGLSNVTLSYLWNLRCLNSADQLLDDATMGGKTMTSGPQCPTDGANQGPSEPGKSAGVCIGSSQNFGFTSLQLSNLEAQIELATDIYKNWRVTNVTAAMVTTPTLPQSGARSLGVGGSASASSSATISSNSANLHGVDHDDVPVVGTNIRDFVFESLDGDELNWRYLHLYQNWSRNRMHANFVDQFRRFIWISLQRCLSESSEKLPVKLFDVFTNQKYN